MMTNVIKFPSPRFPIRDISIKLIVKYQLNNMVEDFLFQIVIRLASRNLSIGLTRWAKKDIKTICKIDENELKRSIQALIDKNILIKNGTDDNNLAEDVIAPEINFYETTNLNNPRVQDLKILCVSREAENQIDMKLMAK